jgi:hypothetical protein
MRRFEVAELPVKTVVGRVGDLGSIEHVVEVIVSADFVGEVPHAFPGRRSIEAGGAPSRTAFPRVGLGVHATRFCNGLAHSRALTQVA